MNNGQTQVYCDTSYSWGRLKRIDFLMEEIRNYSQVRRREKLEILDVGCGSGNVAISLGSSGHQVRAIDTNQFMINYAKSINPFENVSFEIEDAGELDITKGEYDIVICTEVLEHLANPGCVIYRIKQVLKPDGLLLITIPNGYTISEFILLLLKWPTVMLQKLGLLRTVKKLLVRPPFLDTKGSPHVQHYTLGKFKKIVGQGDFVITSVQNCGAISIIFPLSYILPRFELGKRMEEWDWRIANTCPSFLAGGWMITCEQTQHSKGQ